MLRNVISLFVSVMGVMLAVSAQAKELPDFTDLVEKQGAAVVNISTTQIIRNMPQGLPNVPEGY